MSALFGTTFQRQKQWQSATFIKLIELCSHSHGARKSFCCKYVHCNYELTQIDPGGCVEMHVTQTERAPELILPLQGREV